MNKFSRREFFQVAASTAGGLAVNPFRLGAQTPTPSSRPRFNHRGYLGWITDFATKPDLGTWPSMWLDEDLLADYRQKFRLMKKVGYNEISVWGLYVSRAWPTDIPKSVTPERGKLVERLIDLAHDQQVKVLSGLGVYSWGFDEIIRAHPEVTKGSPQVMCAHASAAWEWQRKVLDFVFTRFDIDGVSMQSSDQGRCPCPDCKALSNADYYALLNTRIAEYIRSRWPKKIIGVNSWGMHFDEPDALPALQKIGQTVDYIIDVNDTSRRRDPANRRKVAAALACDFGTLGGPQVEPPQHWERDRWFLPTIRRDSTHLRDLAADGGRACEFFYHILANPGDEVTFYVVGRMLAEPAGDWRKFLEETLAELYEPKPAVREALAEIFLAAEDAYLDYSPANRCGTIPLEPLASKPGRPLYLEQGLKAEQRREYGKKITELSGRLRQISSAIGRKEKAEVLKHCLENVEKEWAGIT